MKFILLREGEKWWQRRRRRVSRLTKLLKGRVLPGMRRGISQEKRDISDWTKYKVYRFADRWGARGAKKGAGGTINMGPVIQKLLRSRDKRKSK